MYTIDTEDLLRTITSNQAYLAEKGEARAARPYAILGRCFLALEQPDQAITYFRIAATKALTLADVKQRSELYADAAVFCRLAGDEDRYQAYLAQAYERLKQNDRGSHLPMLIGVCFLREDYPAVIHYTTQLAAYGAEYVASDMEVYYEHQFACAYLAQDRAAMERAVQGLEEKIVLDQPLVYDTPGLNIFDLAAHARDVLARWDATHA